MSKIAIIGSGISGISAAYELYKRGHREIVVFEKDNRLGGKCSTIDIDGHNYDMGAMVVGTVYNSILEMIEETGCTMRPMKDVELADTEKGKYLSPVQKLKLYSNKILPLAWKVVPEFEKYIYNKTGYKDINKEELGKNFDEWLKEKNLTKYRNVLASFYTTWGYGYFEDTAANYIRKLLDPDRIMRVFVKKPFNKTSLLHLNEGYQTLIERIVEKYKIETKIGININSVQRKNGKVNILTDKGEFGFDKIIIACPFDKALSFLDVSTEEKELMSKVKTRDFHTFTCEVENLPEIEISFSSSDLTIDKAGYPVGWYKRHKDTKVFTFYSDNPHKLSVEKLQSNVEEIIRRFGGKLKNMILHESWEYFPHVSASDVKNGFYERIENLQGKNDTYYMGEILAFPTVEDCSSYARELVKNHFNIIR